MTCPFSTSLSLVFFSTENHLRAVHEPHANGALGGKRIWTNDDSDQLSDYRPVSIVDQIAAEVTDVAAAPTPHVTPATRIMSVFQRHLRNPGHKEISIDPEEDRRKRPT